MGHAGQLMTHRFNHWPNGLIESITSLIFKIMGSDTFYALMFFKFLFLLSLYNYSKDYILTLNKNSLFKDYFLILH